MSLASNNRASLNALLSLIQKDAPLCAALRSSADRLLTPQARADAMRCVPFSASGAFSADAAAALNGLVADVAEN